MAEQTANKKKRGRKSRRVISTTGFGPDVTSNDRYALAAATKIEIKRTGDDTGLIKAAKTEGKDSDSPWSGSAELWRDIEIGWDGDAGKFAAENNKSNMVLQSVWRQLSETDRISVGNQNGLIVFRILKASRKRCYGFILGRSEGKTKK